MGVGKKERIEIGLMACYILAAAVAIAPGMAVSVVTVFRKTVAASVGFAPAFPPADIPGPAWLRITAAVVAIGVLAIVVVRRWRELERQ